MIVSSTHGFLVASPDGIVTDPSEISSEALVEVKLFYCNETLLDCAKRICIAVLNKENPLGITINKNTSITIKFNSKCLLVIKGAVELPGNTFKLGNDIIYWQSKSHLMLNIILVTSVKSAGLFSF